MRQVTNDTERVNRSVVRSILAYFLLVRLYGSEDALVKDWSLFKLTGRFIAEIAQDAVPCTQQKWQRKLQQFEDVA